MDHSENAFEELFSRYKNQAVNYVWQTVRSQQTAEEICQDVFLKVYKNAQSFDRTKRFKPWFWTIVRNATMDRLRKKQDLLYEDLFKNEEDQTIEIEDSNENIELSLIQKMEAQRLQKLIEKLPANQKEVLSLQVFSEMNYEEIANVTGKSISSIKSLLFRARKSLTELMEKENE